MKVCSVSLSHAHTLDKTDSSHDTAMINAGVISPKDIIGYFRGLPAPNLHLLFSVRSFWRRSLRGFEAVVFAMPCKMVFVWPVNRIRRKKNTSISLGRQK